MCGFNLRLKPGLHRFEFYTVDTSPIQIFTLTFPLKAGSVYELIGSSKEQKILEDGKEIAVERGDVPVLVEPEPTEPHATLIVQRDKLSSRNVYVLRVDGKIRAPMYKLHPRWVVMNYSGLARGVILFVPKGPFLDLAAYMDLLPSNIEAAEGSLVLRLSPGPH
ncbi:hypothetical protein [Gracilinema caldarium]|uniref:hypothetical protein n=1 Tax=Gracilinema caldarium TaxID=215591 RepID=UPI0026E9321B|nr:hypothetical protein [Gracilinema caldarium]